jgi:hypothetical protein
MVLFLSFHLTPFLPFEVQVIVHTRTATHGRHVPSLYVLGPLVIDHARHCHPHATIPPSFLLHLGTHLCWSFSFLNLRSISCRLRSLRSRSLSTFTYTCPVGRPRNACLSAKIPVSVLHKPKHRPPLTTKSTSSLSGSDS